MKYKSLIILFLLVVVRSLFFGMFKFYYRGMTGQTLNFSLEQISWYLSIWSVIAFILWSALYQIYWEKILLIACWIISLLLLLTWYHFWLWWYLLISTIAIWIGLTYWLWSVTRNIMISTEIQQNWYSDTVVNWLCTIWFVVALIVWSILWSTLAENFWQSGNFYIMWLMLLASILGALVLYWGKAHHNKKLLNVLKEYFSQCIPAFWYIWKRYWYVMIISAFLLVLATIISQKAIEYSVEILGKKTSEASFILLYSAIGTVIWNAISMKLNIWRWKFFVFFTTLFGLQMFIFPFFMDQFNYLVVLAIIAGILFGVTYNLIESYFLMKIGQDNKREFWSTAYWLICSLVISVMMFLTHFMQNIVGFNWIFYIVGAILIAIWGIILIKQNKLV